MIIHCMSFAYIFTPTFRVGDDNVKTLRLCVTFDVDFAEYTNGWSAADEFASVFPSIMSVFQRHANWKATWFVRLDAQMEMLYGRADYILRQYKTELRELRQNGHEIGWHPHCYVQVDGQWRQNTNAAGVVDELIRYAPQAKSYRLRSVRMGWGFHTNQTMRLLDDLGFAADSSAIPRPKYQWEETKKDWAPTPLSPYFPSKSDYRISGQSKFAILEVPISVTHVKAPYDTEYVLRYINPAYHSALLLKPLELWLTQYSHLVTITHPYELVTRDESYGLLAFNLETFEQNLVTIQEFSERQGALTSFLTISEFANLYRR